MQNNALNKNFDAKKLLFELYNHNQYLQARVGALTDLVAYILRSMGESTDDIEVMAKDLTKKHTEDIITTDADGMYSERWDKILGELKDIDGVDLGGKE